MYLTLAERKGQWVNMWATVLENADERGGAWSGRLEVGGQDVAEAPV